MKLLRSLHRRLGLKYRFDRCRHYVRRFGLRGAVTTYRRAWFGSGEVELQVPGLAHPLIIRSGTADASTLEKMFVWNEYELEYPRDVRCVVDAGANIGLSAAFFATRFPDAMVVAVEPERGNFDLLRHNTERYPNVVLLHAALWGRDGTLGLCDAEQPVDSFRFSPEATQGAVQAFGVSSILERFGLARIDVLKIDIEGGETEVFRTPDDWIARVGMFVVELHGPEARASFLAATAGLRATRYSHGENEIVRAEA